LKQGLKVTLLLWVSKLAWLAMLKKSAEYLRAKALGELRLLDDRRIRARLERTAKDVASAGGEGALNRYRRNCHR